MYGKYSVLNEPDYKDELKKLNKRIYNKKHRLKKNYGVKLDMDTMKMEDFKNKREFDKFRDSVMKVADRKADPTVKNVKGADMKLNKIKEAKQIIEKSNQVKLERLEYYIKQPFTDRGEETGWTLGDVEYGFQSEKFGSLQPLEFNPDRFRTEKELDVYLETKKEVYADGFLERRDKHYQDNYVAGIKKVFDDDLDDVVDKIQSMTPKEFVDMYYTENIVNIEFIYQPRQKQIKADTLRKQFLN